MSLGPRWKGQKEEVWAHLTSVENTRNRKTIVTFTAMVDAGPTKPLGRPFDSQLCIWLFLEKQALSPVWLLLFGSLFVPLALFKKRTSLLITKVAFSGA